MESSVCGNFDLKVTQISLEERILNKSICLFVHAQGCHSLENEIFSRSGKRQGIFGDGQGNLERTWKVREKSGNMKMNGYGSPQKIYIFCSQGKGCTF